MATRTYEQRARVEESERTRKRIIEAVFMHLELSPTAPIAVGEIARLADVARSTIYAVFGSRSGLLEAAARELEDRSRMPELLEDASEDDVRVSTRNAFRVASGICAANRVVFRALRSMAELEGEAAYGTFVRMEETRAIAMQELAARLEDEGVLRTGVSRAEAENMLWILTSFESFELLYAGRNLSVEEVGEQLIAMAERLLYEEPSSGQAG